MGGFFRRFMAGRYGSDKLNMTMLITAVVLSLISMFIPNPLIQLIMMAGYYFLLGFSIFRMMSRNVYKRYQENRKFLQFIERIRDRQHKYFNCPKCRQQVRVPRGKGKISICCPKCKEKFIKKT